MFLPEISLDISDSLVESKLRIIALRCIHCICRFEYFLDILFCFAFYLEIRSGELASLAGDCWEGLGRITLLILSLHAGSVMREVKLLKSVINRFSNLLQSSDRTLHKHGQYLGLAKCIYLYSLVNR